MHQHFSYRFAKLDPECDSEDPALALYDNFIDPQAKNFKDMSIVQLESFPKHCKIKSTGQASSKKQTLICKYRGCHARFVKISSLVDHLLVHDDIFPFECGNCRKSYR